LQYAHCSIGYLLPRCDRKSVSKGGGNSRAFAQTLEDVLTKTGDRIGREGLDKISIHAHETSA
jgi:hypothetical protein